ncbi:MAG: helix-turn-helix domain-containing protein [Clostridiales bacterium]|nr:helix-turn-helix domain-containing protein [Clostridiales bacterium]
MSLKSVGKLIREARTNAGLTQEQLARKVKGATAADISKAERGEKGLTNEQLKAVAKATGVTQKSLLDAAKGTTASSAASSSSSSSSSSKTSLKLTAAEKKLVELYRKADADTKKSVMDMLSKDPEESSSSGGLLGSLTGGSSSQSGGLLGSLLSGAASLLGGKREMPEDGGTDEN